MKMKLTLIPGLCSPTCVTCCVLSGTKCIRMRSVTHVRVHFSPPPHRNLLFPADWTRNCRRGREQSRQCFSGARRLDKAGAVLKQNSQPPRQHFLHPQPVTTSSPLPGQNAHRFTLNRTAGTSHHEGNKSGDGKRRAEHLLQPLPWRGMANESNKKKKTRRWSAVVAAECL